MAKGNGRDIGARNAEAEGLAAAIGLIVKQVLTIRVRTPRPATLFGLGQVDRIASAASEAEAELVVVDGAVTPVQQKNLEDRVGAKVIDRTGLILEIFGERAATAEGRLQVELAHLDYQLGRLVRSWTHLERQRGGFGFLGGPGETQIETDRRLIRDRIAKLRRELEAVTRTRRLHRRRRQRAPWPVIALVGYTNAGKSTLFNRLTGSAVAAEDLLFATLDPTMREIALPGIEKAVLSDTVGFVSELPTQLVAAFRATLEEVVEADLLIHVRDISRPDSEAQRADVERLLAEIGALTNRERMIEAWNKVDALAAAEAEAACAEAARREGAVVISARSGEGVGDLLNLAAFRLHQGLRLHRIELLPSEGEAIAWLHARGEVVDEVHSGRGSTLDVRLSDVDWARFKRRRVPRQA
ncbi:MAG: GTPase HflX [Sphingosinicella sp.]